LLSDAPRHLDLSLQPSGSEDTGWTSGRSARGSDLDPCPWSVDLERAQIGDRPPVVLLAREARWTWRIGLLPPTILATAEGGTR
jgi:hypothetical protein